MFQYCNVFRSRALRSPFANTPVWRALSLSLVLFHFQNVNPFTIDALLVGKMEHTIDVIWLWASNVHVGLENIQIF